MISRVTTYHLLILSYRYCKGKTMIEQYLLIILKRVSSELIGGDENTRHTANQ